jgi:8-oxo-dGTP diphosphatase
MSKKEHFRIYIAVYLALIKGEKTLLLRRCNTGYQDGNYSLIAGHLDGDETAKHAMLREAKEEAGIELRLGDLSVSHTMHRLSHDREYIDLYITTNNWEGEIENLEPGKCDDLQWFSFDSLPNNMVPEVRQALISIREGVSYSEFGWKT